MNWVELIIELIIEPIILFSKTIKKFNYLFILSVDKQIMFNFNNNIKFL